MTTVHTFTLAVLYTRPRHSSMFGSVVTSDFQITFRTKMHVNDVFSFFKNYFWHQHIKTIQNEQIILNFNKKKISKFLKTHVEPCSQTLSKLRGRGCAELHTSLYWKRALKNCVLNNGRKKKKHTPRTEDE
jgi:tmRNA-binding protein